MVESRTYISLNARVLLYWAKLEEDLGLCMETVDKIIELVGKNGSLVILASSLQPPTPLPSPQVLGLKTRRLLQPSRRPATQQAKLELTR
jgi:hypothetical protein